VAKRIDVLINKILSERDLLAIQSADEVTAGEQFTVKHITYGKREPRLAETPMEVATPVITKGLKNIRAGLKKTEQSAEAALAAVDAAKPAKKKRKMKPLTPERKAQLVATLAKARAAKKGKA
jgi:hypothetical protein